LAQADEVDGYGLWRRQTLDICQRLPTLEEVKCIQANSGEMPYGRFLGIGDAPGCDIDFSQVISDCLNSEAFAESIGRWVNDFILPSEIPSYSQYNYIVLNETTLTDDEEVIPYWYGFNSSWGDCLDGVSLTSSNIDDYLDKAYAPYWWAGGVNGTSEAGLSTDEADQIFAYVCKKEVTDEGSQKTYSLADTDATVTYNGRSYTCQRSNRNFPCGCGPNMRWCLVRSNFKDDDGGATSANNESSWWRLKRQALEEPGQFVKQVVLRENGILSSKSPPFTDIFNGSYAVRTSRLQHYYEVMQADHRDSSRYTDECHRLITGIDKNSESASCATTMTGNIDYVDYTDPNSPPSGVSVGIDGGDWQVVDFTQKDVGNTFAPLEYQSAGILTSWQLLNRQPTEPNIANRIYSFWTCEEVSWRSNDPFSGSDYFVTVNESDYSLKTYFGGTDNFSTIFRTTAALEPLSNTEDSNANCAGCHVTVNPLAAFRNRWDEAGRYREADYSPDGTEVDSAQGIFLGSSADDMTGFGNLLANSGVVHRCIVNRSFERLVGHRLDSDSDTLQSLTETFLAADKDIRALYDAILDTDEYRKPR